MIYILDDVEKLTGVKASVLAKIITCINYAIIDNIFEEIYSGKDCVEIDIGVGILSIFIADDEVHYSFRPTQELETGIIRAVNDKENALEEKLSSSINSHVYKTYKDML